ncbi:hypothetical protein FFLO_06213 [Filobasidium floriforme]|uniref:Glycoside hydrolase family 2 catalytic domain-containing protein n=1 Tax=Filobasidium floriforme TaxID=5210 RepID=A0A8K0JFB6_9TREE|nr:hypothetical protein FFLO_06213 [Filobasidium floriforme]
MIPPEKETIGELFDIIGINRYYGWYEVTGDLVEAEQLLEDELVRWEKKYQKPLVMLEYGADTVTGLHSIINSPWSEEFLRHVSPRV